LWGSNRCTAMVGRCRARPAGVFPLRLRRQAIKRVLFFGKPVAKGDRIVPGDAGHRMIVAGSPPGILPGALRVHLETFAWNTPVAPGPFFFRWGLVPRGAHKSPKLLDFAFVSPHEKGLADRYLVLGFIGGAAARL